VFDMEFIERENEILKTIKSMADAGLDFVVVGGYAVSALARHRFSVDCDLVVPKKKLDDFENFLGKEGYEKHIEKAGFDKTYAGEFVSYKKEVGGLPITIDLLVGSLVCRATQAAWSFEYVKKHSITASIAGTEASVSCRIPEKELLIAFKIHSGRRADVRDVIMLREGADLGKVLNHLRKGNIEALKDQIKKTVTGLEDKNLVDSLKGVFTLSADVKKQIENTRKDVEAISRKLQ
jgi:predicted nucleotidyltransferase